MWETLISVRLSIKGLLLLILKIIAKLGTIKMTVLRTNSKTKLSWEVYPSPTY